MWELLLLRINLIMRLSIGGNFRIWLEIPRNCEEPFHPNFGQKFDSYGDVPNKVCFNTTLPDKIVHVLVVLGTGTGDYNMDNVAFKKLLQLAIVFGPKHSNGN